MISIIIINFNSTNDTIRCLNSLKYQNYEDYEVIIIDNGSNDVNKNLLSKFLTSLKTEGKFYNRIKIIYSNINLGYGGGNNLGIKNSKGDIILLLNNDTIHSVSFLETMGNFFNQYKSVHIAQPLIYYLDKKNKIWCNGYKFYNFSYYLYRNLNFIEIDLIKRPYRIDCADGCAFFIRREVLREIGLLERIFFIYGESGELCYRARLKGYNNIYCNPLTEIYHDIQLGFSDLQKHYFFRNRMIFFLKHFSFPIIIVQSLFLFVRVFLIAVNLKTRKFDYKFFYNSMKKIVSGFILGLKIRLS